MPVIEGLFYQTERRELYRKEAERLLKEGKAYRCVCTPEELDVRREATRARGEKPRYDRKCRELPLSGTEGKSFVVRFRTPLSGETVVRDLLRGDVAYENRERADHALPRPAAPPTHNI